MAEQQKKTTKMEPREIIAYLGPPASYTHQAAIKVFPNHPFIPQSTIEDVFQAVQNEHASIGIVPFENSSNGHVVETLDLLGDREGSRFGFIQVCGEVFVDVHHCLLGRAKRVEGHDQNVKGDDVLSPQPPSSVTPLVSPGKTSTVSEHSEPFLGTFPHTNQKPSTKKEIIAPLDDIFHIKKVYSHVQALGQCRGFLSTYVPGAELQQTSSTSKAADMVASTSHHDLEEAAIASELAASIYNLDVLARSIEDGKGNRTRFLIIRKNNTIFGLDPDLIAPTQASVFKALLYFRVEHASPGALAECLAVFGKHGLNLTSTASRPSGLAPWNYVFFVEVMGARSSNEYTGQKALAAASEDLNYAATHWRNLGSWTAVDHSDSNLEGGIEGSETTTSVSVAELNTSKGEARVPQHVLEEDPMEESQGSQENQASEEATSVEDPPNFKGAESPRQNQTGEEANSAGERLQLWRRTSRFVRKSLRL
ncbi:MAG: prephenate dehydratase [Bathelium mastoideum]|nr:MAG: prephenate dehydratase [Bathelium mastoideum]KAI9687548.1 MAG: prephenate dehydratase [Bathelium mastoideum]